MNNNVELDELVKEKVKPVETSEHSLVLYNDEVNTFQHVILCLVGICRHDKLQAEQCAIIAHHTGKCVIKTGNYFKLEKMKVLLDDSNLTVEIQ